jgi:hypothetical protein
MAAIGHGHLTGLTDEQAPQSPFGIFRWWASTRRGPPNCVAMNQIALRMWS